MLNGTERLRRYVDDLLDLQHARDPAEGTADLDAALAGAVEELRVFIERAKARVESGALGQAAVAPAKAERVRPAGAPSFSRGSSAWWSAPSPCYART